MSGDSVVTSYIRRPKYTMDMFIMKHPEQSTEKYTEIVRMYKEKVSEHNKKVCESKYPDSGFDLLVPYDYSEHAFGYTNNRISPTTFRAPLGVKCAMVLVDSSTEYAASLATPVGYYLYPRSSIVKTPFRMANSVGIIDAGYRGHLIGMFDLPSGNTEHIKKFDRYLQICAPGLVPIVVELVNNLNDLGEETERGTGGFGSTGI